MNSLPEFNYLRPATAADAVRMHAANPASHYIAGGTDLMPNIRRGLVTIGAAIDLGAITELADIVEQADTLRIGSGVTLARIAAHPAVQARLPAIAQGALSVAGPTHRAGATLGGNLCLDTRCNYYNQSEAWRAGNNYCMKRDGEGCRVAKKSKRCYAAFCGDVAPALIALGAEVEILGAEGVRRQTLPELYRDDGMKWLTLASGELLLAVRVPLDDAWVSAYEKVRMRGAIDFPLAGVAVALRREKGVLTGLRIACTGVASQPLAIDGLDAVLGKPLDDASLALISEQADLANRSMKTTLVDVLYRRGVSLVLAKRLTQRLWDAAA
ncbi:4-hydroxybenzoyl-CoA reductase subunit beta [Sulfuritalea sp.]|uniref:4-hydroxybenzoyl-CoA reductase subunit beta n=1 Tax=Sulfuritalea sp. TaxID=2480090 RepID=UPI00286DDAC0|nr:4-hydroxybenzoyl-CoA reductase subunit beta [Sulfuritalea sp.]